MSDDIQRAAEQRKAAAQGSRDAAEARFIEALKVERQGYVTRGLTERVAAVDAELKARGVEVEVPAPTTRKARRG